MDMCLLLACYPPLVDACFAQAVNVTTEPVSFHFGIREDRRAKRIPLYMIYIAGKFMACRLNIVDRCIDRPFCNNCFYYHWPENKCAQRKSQCKKCSFDICWCYNLVATTLVKGGEGPPFPMPHELLDRKMVPHDP